jgi:hypothetical protein
VSLLIINNRDLKVGVGRYVVVVVEVEVVVVVVVDELVSLVVVKLTRIKQHY